MPLDDIDSKRVFYKALASASVVGDASDTHETRARKQQRQQQCVCAVCVCACCALASFFYDYRLLLKGSGPRQKFFEGFLRALNGQWLNVIRDVTSSVGYIAQYYT